MLRFNTLLGSAGISPSDVRLLRHQPFLPTGELLLDLWRTKPHAFSEWQSIQRHEKLAKLNGRYWASFIGTPSGKSVFDGLYSVGGHVRLEQDMTLSLTGTLVPAGTLDRYSLSRHEAFEPYAARLLIDWGGGSSGKRAWIQRADNQNKAIVAILEQAFETPFPGYMAFRRRIEALGELSEAWINDLSAARGVYLLTCPATGRHYVGSATGVDGFWGRWSEYRRSGHGGNVGLFGVETAPFSVSILQVAGSGDTETDIIMLEQIWKNKLASLAFGFNHN